MRHLLVESSHNFTSESLPDDNTYLPFLEDTVHRCEMCVTRLKKDLENVTEDMAEPSCA